MESIARKLVERGLFERPLAGSGLRAPEEPATHCQSKL